MEDCHWAKSVVITVGKNHPWTLEALRKGVMRNKMFAYAQSYLPRRQVQTENSTLQWGHPADTTVTEWSRLTSPVKRHNDSMHPQIRCTEKAVASLLQTSMPGYWPEILLRMLRTVEHVQGHSLWKHPWFLYESAWHVSSSWFQFWWEVDDPWDCFSFRTFCPLALWLTKLNPGREY